MRFPRESSARGFAIKSNELVIVYFEMNLDRLAADLAIFNIGLRAVLGEIEQHGNSFPAVGAFEFLLGF